VQVPPPATNKPTEAEFFAINPNGERKPNPAFLKEHFFHEGRLLEEQALFILNLATRTLAKEPNMVEVKSPVTGTFLDPLDMMELD
jgi:serine/threonine-protein phosphatase 2B catalytic subunit